MARVRGSVERGAFAGDRVDADRAVETIDRAPDDVAADAATGDVSGGGLGAETGGEDEVFHLLIVDRGLGRDEAHLHALGVQRSEVEAVAVVADLEDDLSRFLASGESQRA